MTDEDPRTAHEPESDESASAGPERDEHPGSPRRRSPVADWGGDNLFNHVPRRRFTRPGVGAHTRRPSASPITSHRLRRNADFAAPVGYRGAEMRDGESSVGTLGGAPHSAAEPSLITIYEPEARLTPAPTAGGATARGRRRPRSVDERVGPRPDRIAALAFVLGMLLVLLAVATADAASLATF
jgi:hypothetical protein